MPRPKKWRRVCALPQINRFGPMGVRGSRNEVVMTIDEYETIRLIDLESLTQEECAKTMNVGRTTVQAIYEIARKKLADVVVNGKRLVIEGGEYRICEERTRHCGMRKCRNI